MENARAQLAAAKALYRVMMSYFSFVYASYTPASFFLTTFFHSLNFCLNFLISIVTFTPARSLFSVLQCTLTNKFIRGVS